MGYGLGPYSDGLYGLDGETVTGTASFEATSGGSAAASVTIRASAEFEAVSGGDLIWFEGVLGYAEMTEVSGGSCLTVLTTAADRWKDDSRAPGPWLDDNRVADHWTRMRGASWNA